MPYLSSFAACLRHCVELLDIIVVFTPLVNLMKDQATKLENICIPAVVLSDIHQYISNMLGEKKRNKQTRGERTCERRKQALRLVDFFY